LIPEINVHKEITVLYQKYFGKVQEILAKAVATQGSAIEKAAEHVADSVSKGGLFHVFGCGHSQMYAMEVFYRAGGLVPVNAILTPALALFPCAPLSTFGERIPELAGVILQNEPVKPGDTLLIASTSARNNVPIEMAMEAKQRGLKVVLLYSSEFAASISSRHRSGKLAMEYADVLLDNCGISGDAIMSLEGVDAKFGPTSSVVGFALIQAVMVQVVENLVNRGVKPPIWVSSNLEPGDAINRAYIEKYRSVITNL
jgi:uncharacterized phosphosugar-binding protein